MTLTEEDKNWILEAITRAQQIPYRETETARSKRTQPLETGKLSGVSGRIDDATKTGEKMIVGGVRLAGLGLSVIARISQVTTKALGAGVDAYVSELGDAMRQKHADRESLLR